MNENTRFPRFQDLESVDRHLVLSWVREAIHTGMKKTIVQNSYSAFIRSLNTDSEFSVEKIWDSVPEAAREKFGLASDILASVESDMEAIEDELEEAARQREEENGEKEAELLQDGEPL